jgi:peptidoglycan/LPS O-acetylase OafA/YrhL
MKYRPEIDGLRAIAVLPVIFFHAGFDLFSGGYVGVDVFFVISGFLITSILIKEIDAGSFSLTHFYERRARRILPALYAVLLVSAVIAAFVLLPRDLVAFGKSLMSVPVFASNIYFWSERGYFDAAIDLKPLLHTWSLAVEEQFYLIFPLVMMALWRFPRIFLGLLILAAFASFALSVVLTDLHFETAFFLPFTRAWELAVGSLIAILVIHSKVINHKVVADVVAFMGLALIGYAIFAFDKNTPFPSFYAGIPVLGTAAFIWATTRHQGLSARLISARALVWIGLVSYSAYLWHQPIFAFARHMNMFEDHRIFWIALSLLLAFAAYFVVEQPFRKKNKIDTKTVWRFALIGGAVLMLVGGGLVASNGLMGKYAPADQKILKQLDTFGAYNHKRFDALKGAPFKDNDKIKVLLVGDSYARDLLNLVYEGGYDSDFQFSTHHVRADCGIFYSSDADYKAKVLEENVPQKTRKLCAAHGRFEVDNVQARLREADEVWLNAYWYDWVVTHLASTVEALERDYNVKLRVFGMKDFGAINVRTLLKIPEEERLNYRHRVSTKAREIEARIKAALDASSYYKILDLLCGGDSGACKIFTNSGTLVSTDGGHLTKDSAKELAPKLTPIFDQIKRASD